MECQNNDNAHIPYSAKTMKGINKQCAEQGNESCA